MSENKYRIVKRKADGELVEVAVIDIDLTLANTVAEKLNKNHLRTRNGKYSFIVEKEG